MNTQPEQQRMATLLQSPELATQMLPCLNPSSWTLDANRWLFEKYTQHLGLYKTAPTINILLDYANQEANTPLEEIAMTAAKVLLTEYAKQSPVDATYFRENMLREARDTEIKNTLLECVKSNDWERIKEVIEETQTRSTALPEPISRKDMILLPSTDKACLLNDWAFERGEVIGINAPTGVGKSVLAYQLGVHWSVGKECLAMKPNGALKVLLIQNEDTTRTMATQDAGATQHLTASDTLVVDTNFIPIRLRGYSGKAFVKALEQYFKRYKPDVVIINPLSKYFGDDEISGKAVADFFNNIEPLLDKYQCGMVIFSHTKKQSKSPLNNELDDLYNQYGSSKWGDFIRETLNIKTTDHKQYYHLWASRKREKQWGWSKQVIKQADKGELPYWSVCNENDIPIEARREKTKVNHNKQTCLLAIPFTPNSCSKQDLLTATGASDKTIRSYLDDFKTSGKVRECEAATESDDTLNMGRREKRYQRVKQDNSNN